MTTNIEETLAAIRGEITNPEDIPSADGQVRTPYYKVANRHPAKKYDDANPFLPGMVIAKDQPPVESVKAVILFSQDARRWQRNTNEGLETVCCSFDGNKPAPRIENPQCQKLDAGGVAAVLSKFRGFDEARIKAVTSDLLDGTDRLQFCTLKSRDGSGIPICPKAKGNKDEGIVAVCKRYVAIVGYDIERGQLFKMNLGGSSIRGDEKTPAPLIGFKHWLAQKRVPYYHIAVTLSAKEDGNFYQLDVTDYTPIADREMRARLKAMADEAKSAYAAMAAWRPLSEEEKAEKDKFNNARFEGNHKEVALEGDDIPF